MTFAQCAEVHVCSDNATFPVIESGPGYINTVTGYGPYTRSHFPAGSQEQAWCEVDLYARMGIPIDAKGVFVSGTWGFTPGATSQPNLVLIAAFAKPSSALTTAYYMMRTTVTRSTFSTWIPLENGKYKFWWDNAVNGYTDGSGNVDPWVYRHPTYASYLLNFTVQAWSR